MLTSLEFLPEFQSQFLRTVMMVNLLASSVLKRAQHLRFTSAEYRYQWISLLFHFTEICNLKWYFLLFLLNFLLAVMPMLQNNL
jgi:hypothetical protein